MKQLILEVRSSVIHNEGQLLGKPRITLKVCAVPQLEILGKPGELNKVLEDEA